MSKLFITDGFLKKSYIYYNFNRNVKPTKFFIRQSLFFFLKDFIKNKLCLDFFCGTGILGLSCISLLSKKVHFIDNNKFVLRDLSRNLSRLCLVFSNLYVLYFCCFSEYLILNLLSYDFIIIDSPYKYIFIIETIIKLLYLRLNLGGYIYIENAISNNLVFIINTFNLFKIGYSGKVIYYLIKK